MRPITLTTDFGNSDPYVGAMKGVIEGLSPGARIVDLTHEIRPHDVRQGAFVLAGACRWFPQGSVHVAVVDPGVGTARRGIVVETSRHLLVGPDNGLFSGVLAADPPLRSVSIDNPDAMRNPISSTFHGRDVFAPAAARLSRGMPLHAIGAEAQNLVRLDLWETRLGQDGATGSIVHIDRFGNCVTNLTRAVVTRYQTDANVDVAAGQARFRRLVTTYGDVREGEALLYFGSLGTLEIGIRAGHAANVLGLGRGAEVCVKRAGDAAG